MHRSHLSVSGELEGGETAALNSDTPKMMFVAFMTMTEFIIFAAEDATVLFIWWETGTYNTDDVYAVANLYITIASSLICTLAFLGTNAMMWVETPVGKSRWTLVVPCIAEDKKDAFIGSFLAFWFPILLVGAMSFWTYIGLAYINQGRCPLRLGAYHTSGGVLAHPVHIPTSVQSCRGHPQGPCPELRVPGCGRGN